MLGLDQLATVFTETATTGKFTTLHRQALACRLVHVPLQRAQTQTERKELASLRNMLFDPDYVMPEACQVVVDGVTWEPRAGTFTSWRDWNSNIVYRSCDIFRQQVTTF